MNLTNVENSCYETAYLKYQQTIGAMANIYGHTG